MSDIWYVYLLTCADDTLYCGITKDIAQRVQAHNGVHLGGAKYTRGRRPVSLSVFVQADSHKTALSLERTVKKLPRKNKILYMQSLQEAL